MAVQRGIAMEQIRVNGTRPYDISLGRGAFRAMADIFPRSGQGVGSVCLICDTAVAASYAEQAEQMLRALGYAVSRFSFSEYEKTGSLGSYERLIGHLREVGIRDRAILVALGGSVVQELTGFTAATYGSYIRWVSVPTTLSAMIAPRRSERRCLRVAGSADSVGIECAPMMTVCDPVFLETLPDTQVRSGYAYIVQYSMSGFDGVTRSLPKIRDLKIPEPGGRAELPSDETVEECVRASVFDRGKPDDGTEVNTSGADNAAPLFGDGLADAIAEATSFSVSRGYALAAAMGIMAQLSVRSCYCDRKRYRYLTTRLMQFGLPTGTALTADELISHIPSLCEEDRERKSGVCVLRDVGTGVLGMNASEFEEKLRDALDNCKTICAGTVRDAEVYLPYSKELVIRMALAWFLDGFSLLNLSEMPGDDIMAMDRCLRGLLSTSGEALPCGESATVLRLLLPLIGVLDIDNVRFALGEGLFLRPHDSFLKLLRGHGMQIKVDNAVREYTVGGRLVPGEYEITDRNAAEQVCGLLFVLPLLHGDSFIRVPEGILRKNLIHMTINILHMSGVNVNVAEGGYAVSGEQRYDRFGLRNVTPERDWSLAALFETLSFITGEEIPIVELPKVSLQGEQVIREYLEQLREAISEGEEEVRIDLGDVPNLIPCVALAASLTDGVTVTLTGLEVLGDREGNRIQSIALVLATLGADIRIGKADNENGTETDAYIIRGRGCLNGGIVDSMGDHRIAMTAAIAAWGCEQPVTVTDSEAVNRSFPGFFEELKKLI